MLINKLVSNIFIFLVPLAISLLLTPLVRYFAIRNKFIARPKAQRFHRKVTALLGGVGIFIASLFGIFNFVHLDAELLVFLAGGIFIFFWGLSDDFRPMRPQVKLLGQIIAGCIVVFFGISFNLPKYQVLSYLFTIIWVVGITNAFNLLDNMDGLAAGTAAICAMMIFASSSMLNNDGVGIIGLILAAACLGFLPYNFNPAKIYMGDSGSMFLGYSLALLSIIGSYQNVSNIIATLVIPVLILAVPIFDTLFVMLMRNLRGKAFWEGGKDHTSHRLVSLGLSEKKTVILLYILSLFFGLIALLYTKIDIILILIFTGLTIIVLLFFGIFLSEVKTYDKEEILISERRKREKVGNLVLNTVLLYKRNFLEVIVDLALICISYYFAYLLKYEGGIPSAAMVLITKSLPFIIVIKLICFFFFGIYSRIWPYMSISDVISIFKAVSLSSLTNIVLLTFLFRFQEYSRVIFILDWLIMMFLAIGVRVIIPLFSEFLFSARLKEKNIIIFGAGDTGEAVVREIKRNRMATYHPIGFLDDDERKVRRNIRGIPVLGTRDKLEAILKNKKVEELFIAIPSLSDDEFRQLSSLCERYHIRVRKIGRILDF